MIRQKARLLALPLAIVIASTGAPFNIARAEIPDAAPRPASAAPTQAGTDNARRALSEGRALLKRGRASEALVRLDNALKLFTAANDNKGQAAAQDALGELYERQGQYNVALGFYQQAYDSFVRAGNDESAVAAAAGFSSTKYNANLMLAKIGNANLRQNKIPEARAAYGQMNAQKPADTLTGGGGGRGGRRGLGGLLGSAANVAMSGGANASTAINAAMAVKQAFDAYRQLIIYSTYEMGMGRIDFANSQLDTAKKHFENALAAAGGGANLLAKLGQTRRFRVAARTSLGDVAFAQRRYADAVKLYTEAATGAQKDSRLDLMWPAQRGLGRSRWALASAERDQNKATRTRDEALAAYRDSLRTIETIRAGSLRADEARSTFLATTRDVFDEASSYMAEMALLNSSSPNGGELQGRALEYAAEAFRVSEAGRARSLLDLLGETGTEITEGVPAELLQRKRDNLNRQQELATELTGVNVNAEQKKSAGDLEDELERLQTESDQIENQIRAASPRYASLTAPQPLTLAETQQRVLDDRTVLLEYSLGDQASYMWAIGNKSVSLYKLPARSVIEGQVASLRDQILPASLRRSILQSSGDQQRGLNLGNASTGNNSASGAGGNVSSYATAANAVYKTAIEPAASLIGDRRVLVVADGALNYIPFGALVTAPGGTDYAALPYLIKTNEIVYAPSASVVAAISGQPRANSGNRAMLIVADPVFSQSDPRARGGQGAAAQTGGEVTRGLALGSALTDVAGAPAQTTTTGNAAAPSLVRLNGTSVEAQQIAQLARTSQTRADTWTGLEASESNIEGKDLKSYRVLHVATHGLLNAQRPQFTGLVFSLVGNRSEDGFLRTDEVFNLRLGQPLVMLSACETGLGKEKRGEGVIGLTRAFMYAGAPTVGVSLWSVSDRSTAELMTNFYRRLLTGQGQPPAASMREAQTQMIASKRFSQPFYWAPFVLVGDWR
ncbi:MAG: CHAT domain-containing protein [Pyrinomonadaceae bacterium]|nr:CHAT domain-containing protein [Pyrinomonadaceae bacterium]